MICGGKDTSVLPRRQRHTGSPQLTGGEHPYQLKPGDCGRVAWRDEWQLIERCPDVLSAMSRRILAQKLFHAAKTINRMRAS
jgi:hypothetical protein